MTNLGQNQDRVTNRMSSCSNTIPSTSTTVVTDPGVFLRPEDLERIRAAYVDSIGALNGSVAHYLEGVLKRGMEVDVMLDAIEQTGWAPRPSAQYLRAILKRLEEEGVRSMQQLWKNKLQRDVERYEANEEKWNRWYRDGEAKPWW